MNFWRKIQRPIIGLSPMDGVTDASFRYVTARHGGPDVTFTEFVNIQAARYAAETLIKDLTYAEIERPIIAQIYGRSPELFYQVAHIVGELGFDGLDINMGCPARKVAAAGCGAALIRTPELARSIIRAAKQGIAEWSAGQSLSDVGVSSEVIERIRSSNRQRTGLESTAERRPLPISVKTRIGYDCIAVENWIATLLEEKPAVISLHGRTLQQGYKGSADWHAIARAVGVARGSETSILGNGDLQDMAEVYRRVIDTGVHGVLIGRSAQGNPWIFRAKDEVKRALAANREPSISDTAVGLEKRFDVIMEHSRHHEQFAKGEGFVAIRKHLTWYCRGFRGAAELRSQLVRVRNSADVLRCLRSYAAPTAVQYVPTAPAPEERTSNDCRLGIPEMAVP